MSLFICLTAGLRDYRQSKSGMSILYLPLIPVFSINNNTQHSKKLTEYKMYNENLSSKVKIGTAQYCIMYNSSPI